MDANKYQEEAMKFAKYAKHEYPFLALGEEAGEVLGKLAKNVRKKGYTVNMAIYLAKGYDEELHADLTKELGDVLWQVQACCFELGLDLGDVMQANLDKLGGREERGTIVGSGDCR